MKTGSSGWRTVETASAGIETMRTRIGLTVILAVMAVQFGSASVSIHPQQAPNRDVFLDRFLAPDDRPLVSYRAFRRLTASTRGGRVQATIEAWTTLDPMQGFSFQVTFEEGNAVIRRKVLIAALEAEQQAVRSSDRAQSALTPANYEFLSIGPQDAHLVRMGIKPRRRHVTLVDGALFAEADSADLVRIDGELSQRPSFWTRRVHIVRDYARIAGVHVPVGMTSTADVLVVGASSFSMTYRYAEINGHTVEPTEGR